MRRLAGAARIIMTAMTDGISVRDACGGDAGACAGIYAHYVLHTAVTFEDAPPPDSEFAARIGKASAAHPFLCAEDAGGVCGYAYADIFRTRCGYRFAVETSVYVDANKPRRGAGVALMTELLARLSQTQTRTAVATIALPNPASVALHEKLGFAACGILPAIGWKFERAHDVGLWLCDFAKTKTK